MTKLIPGLWQVPHSFGGAQINYGWQNLIWMTSGKEAVKYSLYVQSNRNKLTIFGLHKSFPSRHIREVF